MQRRRAQLWRRGGNFAPPSIFKRRLIWEQRSLKDVKRRVAVLKINISPLVQQIAADCVCVCVMLSTVCLSWKVSLALLVPLKSTTERNEHSSNIWLSTFSSSSSSFLFRVVNLLFFDHFSLKESQLVVQSYMHQTILRKNDGCEACVAAIFPTILSAIQGERGAPSLSFREHLSQKAKSRAVGGEEDMAVNHMWRSPAPLIRKVNNKENRWEMWPGQQPEQGRLGNQTPRDKHNILKPEIIWMISKLIWGKRIM